MNNPDQLNQKFFERQWLHLFLLLLLLLGVSVFADVAAYDEGEFLGISSAAWFWVAILASIFHQLYVWIAWRLELYMAFLSRNLENAFVRFKLLFGLLGGARFLIIPLAVANRGTLDLSPAIQWGLSGLFFLLAGYLFYSVIRWFGINRATGLDHFKPGEAKEWGLVNKGIFRFTSNGMYTYGFLVFWAIALVFESSAALMVAAFNHLYIWVHYFCTEKPDMDYIYGDG